MNKKILFSVVAIILIGAGAGFYFFSNKNAGGGSISSFFGFGNPEATPGNTLPGNTQEPGSTNEDAEETVSGIHKISAGPVAGFGMFTKGTQTMVRYQERSRGYVYETPLFDGAGMRISSTTFTAVYESFFGRSGQAAYVRTLSDRDTIKTTLFTIDRDLSFSLAEGIVSLTPSPDAQKAFYLVSGKDGAIGYTASFDSTSPKKIFSSDLSEWSVSWTNTTSVLLGTKPSAKVPGSLSLLNTKTQAVQRVLSDMPGITGTLSLDGKKVVYTTSTGTGMKTSYYTLATGVSSDAPFTTLPEKCVWSTKEAGVIFCAIPRSIPQGEYPDHWYQGVVSFSDEIWKFDVASASPYGRVVASSFSGESIDASTLTLDAAEHYLLFLNKKDGALWGIDLIQEAPAMLD